jgi:hypothetical protein
MEDGYRNWPIVRKLLIDNRLDHAALLAYSIGVSELMFVTRARIAFKKIELRVATAITAAADAQANLEDAIRERAEEMTKKKETKDEPGVAVTLDRVTDEPEPKKE